MSYLILKSIGSGNYNILCSSTDLNELQQKHNELLKAGDPDNFRIVRLLPLTISVSYDVETQGINTNVHVGENDE